MIRNPSRGFSLLEVVVSMGVLGIGLAATVPLVTYGVQRNAQARRATGAQLVADQVIQRLQLEITSDRDGAPNEGALQPETLWNSPTLPHGLGNAIGPVGTCDGTSQTCCNPGPDDGVVYDVAFPFRAQGDDFLVCYTVRAQAQLDGKGNVIPGVGGATTPVRAVQVKVLWQRSDASWSYRTASGFVIGQAGI